MCARFIVCDDADLAEMNRIPADVAMKFDGKGIFVKTGDVFPTENAAV